MGLEVIFGPIKDYYVFKLGVKLGFIIELRSNYKFDLIIGPEYMWQAQKIRIKYYLGLLGLKGTY